MKRVATFRPRALDALHQAANHVQAVRGNRYLNRCIQTKMNQWTVRSRGRAAPATLGLGKSARRPLAFSRPGRGRKSAHAFRPIVERVHGDALVRAESRHRQSARAKLPESLLPLPPLLDIEPTRHGPGLRSES